MVNQGMCRITGKWLSSGDHIAQSVRDILTTRKGTRLLRRHYGGTLPELVDRPMQPSFMAQYAVDIAADLDLWEPRVTLKSVQLTNAQVDGQGTLKLTLEHVGEIVEVNI